MKAHPVVLCLTAVIMVVSVPVYGVDTIGLYTNTAGTNAELNVSGVALFSLYLVLEDPSNVNRIDGWECTIPVSAGA